MRGIERLRVIDGSIMPAVVSGNTSAAVVMSGEKGADLIVLAYHRGLEQTGFVEGKNIFLEYRWADGQYGRLPDMVADLVTRNVAVIMAGGPPAALAAKKATSIIPIVFTSGDDPVQTGLVSSINRPGANVTGVYVFFAELQAKKLSLLRELVPNADIIAFLLNPTFPSAAVQTQEIRAAADKLGQRIQTITASSPAGIDAAFASMA